MTKEIITLVLTLYSIAMILTFVSYAYILTSDGTDEADLIEPLAESDSISVESVL